LRGVFYAFIGPHIVIGAVGYQFGFRSNFNKRWKIFVLIAILTGLPDIDFPLGFIFTGNGYAYHLGITHTIYFAIVAGFFISMGISRKISWLSWQTRWVNFFFCSLMISSHGLVDFFNHKQITLFFHFFGANLSSRYLGFTDFVKIFLTMVSEKQKLWLSA